MNNKNGKLMRSILSIIMIVSILFVDIVGLAQGVIINENMKKKENSSPIIEELIEEDETTIIDDIKDIEQFNKKLNLDKNYSYSIVYKDYETNEEIYKIDKEAKFGSKIKYEADDEYNNKLLVSDKIVEDVLNEKNKIIEIYYKDKPKYDFIKNYTIKHIIKIDGESIEIADKEIGEAFIGTRIIKKPLEIQGFEAKSDSKELYIKDNDRNELVFEYDSNIKNPKAFLDKPKQKLFAGEIVKPEAYITYRAVDEKGNPIIYNNKNVELKFLTTSEETITSDIRLLGNIFEDMTDGNYVLAYESTERTKDIPEEGIIVDMEVLKNPDIDEDKSTYIIEHIGKEYFINIDGKIDHQDLPIQTIEAGIAKSGSKVEAFARKDLKHSKFENSKIIEIDRKTKKESILSEGKLDSGEIRLKKGKIYKFIFNYDIRDEFIDNREEVETIYDDIKSREDIVTELVVKYMDKKENTHLIEEERYPNTVKGINVTYDAEFIDDYMYLKDYIKQPIENKDLNELIHFYDYVGPDRMAKYKIIAKDINGNRIKDYGENGEREFDGYHNHKEYIESPNIRGWTLISKTPIIKTLDKDNVKEAEFIYEKLDVDIGKTTYTERHVVEEKVNGEKIYVDLINRKVGIDKIGTEVTLKNREKELKGYKLIDSSLNSITKVLSKDSNNNEFVFIYERDEDEEIELPEDKDKKYASYTVSYLDKLTNEKLEDTENYKRAIVGAEVKHKAKNIENYKVDEKYKSIVIIDDEEAENNDFNEINFMYEPTKAEYTIKMIDESGNLLDSKKYDDGIPGEDKLVEAPVKLDYTLISKSPLVKKLKVGENVIFTFVYEKLNIGENEVTYTERHVERIRIKDKEYEVDIIDPRIGIDKIGTRVSLSSRKDLKGYKLLPNHIDPIEKTLNKDINKNEYKFVYERDEEEIELPEIEKEDKYAKYTVSYLDEEDQELEDKEVFDRAIVGARVKHKAKTIDNYSPDKKDKEITIMKDSEVTEENKFNEIVFKYSKANVKYKIEAIDEKGNRIKDYGLAGITEHFGKHEEDKIVEAPEISDDWTLISKSPLKRKLEHGKEEVFTFIYEKLGDIGEDKTTYTERHVIEEKLDDEKIYIDLIDRKVGIDKIGTEITIEDRESDLKGYKLVDKNKTKITKILTKNPKENEFIFIYRRDEEEEIELPEDKDNKYSSYTVSYLDEISNEKLENTENYERAIVGAEVKHKAKNIENYGVDKKYKSIIIASDKDVEENNKLNKIEFLYSKATAEYEIIAIDKNSGKVIKNEIKIGTHGNEVIVEALLIEDMVLVSKSPKIIKLDKNNKKIVRFYYDKRDLGLKETIYTERHVTVEEVNGEKVEVDIVNPMVGIDRVGSEVTINFRNDLPGYKLLDYHKKSITKNLSSNPLENEFKFVYEKDGGEIKPPIDKEYATYKVTYRTEDGLELLETDIYDKAIVGAKIVQTAKHVESYEANPRIKEIVIVTDKEAEKDENLNRIDFIYYGNTAKYVIEAKSESGLKLDSTSGYGIHGKEFIANALDPGVGWTLISKSPQIKVLDNKETTYFRFIYKDYGELGDETTYKERHVEIIEVNGEKIEVDITKPVIGVDKIGTNVKIHYREDLKGYTLKNDQPEFIEKDLVEDPNLNEFKFVYEKDGEEVKPPIEKNTATYTVEYLDEGQNELSKKEIYKNAIVGAEITRKARDFNNYEVDEKYKIIKIVDDKEAEGKDNQIIFNYNLIGANYRIEMIDKNTGRHIKDAKIGSGINKEEKTIYAPRIPDWNLVSKSALTKVLDNENKKVFKFLYEQIDIPKGQTIYTERHIEINEEGREIDIVDPKIGLEDIGTLISIRYRDDLEGFKLKENQPTMISKKLIEDGNQNEFKFVYERDGEEIKPPVDPEEDRYAAYRIYYQDENGNDIAPRKEYKRGIVGTVVKHEAIPIKGYAAVGHKVQSMMIVKDKEAAQNDSLNKIIFKYDKSTAKYKVNYHLEGTDKKIAEPSIVEGFDTKVVYAKPEKEIDGYSLISTKPIKIVLDKYKDPIEEVTFYYTKDLDGLVPYTIRHVEEIQHEGETIERDIIDPKVGYDLDRSKIIAKYIDFSNYDLKDKNKESISVVLNKDRFNEIKFIYIKNDEDVDDEKEIEDHNKNKYSSYMVKHTNKNTERSMAEDEMFERAVIGITIEREALRFEEYYAENTPLSLMIKDVEETNENLMEFFYIRRPTTGGGGGGGGGQLPEEDEEDEEIIELDINADHLSYIEGYPDNTVRPENNIKREEVAAIVFRILDPEYRETIRTSNHDFPDVVKDKWSEEYIATLAVENIVEGYTNGDYRPARHATRAEMITMLVRYRKLELEVEEDKFSDTTNHWAKDYINAAANEGWIEGYDGENFRPNNKITRAEFVTMVNNMLGRKTLKENMLDERKEFKDLESYRWYYEAMQEAINSHSCTITPEGVETWNELIEGSL